MPPPPTSPSFRLPVNATPSVTPSKRKLSDQPDSTQTVEQVDKRLRESEVKRARSDLTQAQPAAGKMSMTVLGRRPEIIDLTRSRSTFPAQGGAKKLIVRNLRQASATEDADLERYYRKKREELDDALTAIFARQQPQRPFESLYRGVEDICRNKGAKELADFLRQRCDKYLNQDLARAISAAAGSDPIDVLRSVHKHWVIWNQQVTTIRRTFSYLDRSYLLNAKNLPQINDLAILLFRRMVFGSNKTEPKMLGAKVLEGMCELVDHDRRGDARFDPGLLKDSISMLHVLNIYLRRFEPLFLETSKAYFEQFAEEQSASSLKAYITACERLLAAENYRCNAFNFDSTTKRQLMDSAHRILIHSYSDKLLDNGSVGKLLAEHELESVKALYGLLRLSGIHNRLTEAWEEYIKIAGAAIVKDTARGDEMIVRLLEFRRALDIMVRDAFNQDSAFTYGLREAFGSFINDKTVLSAWKTGTSKVGEMIAKYIDMLLRGGMKTIPKSLLSDSKDRAAAERGGQASTADEDAELDRQLDQALELFRFIEGKDVFEAFYKQDLARRLLMQRSASADAERSMLTKLKSECGSNFTHNLEQMFKDQELARDEMSAYQTWREGRLDADNEKAGLDLNVSILSAAAWPTYPDSNIRLPEGVVKKIKDFESYYLSRHTGRRLTWKHALAHCVVKARFNKGTKELLVSAYQAIVLELFNQDDSRAFVYTEIAEATNLNGPDLDRTLQSLACGKFRVLTKHPKGKDVKPTDTFTVNKAFTDPKYRIKINQVQLKETKEENEDTHRKVQQDRQFETQAAIVRIMKARKTMTHANLVAEVINQTKKRGAVDTGEIKKNIEKLIDKDYLEREGNMYSYLA